MTERRLRPISRLISWVRPPIRPLTDSRSLRVLVARGSIAYSLVTQPRPEPLRQRGTPSVTLAATSTRVCPNSTSTDPSAWPSQPRLNRTGRSSSWLRPSARSVTPTHPISQRRPGHRPGQRAGEVRQRLRQHLVGVGPRRDVGQHHGADARALPGLGGLPAGQVESRRVVRPLQRRRLDQQQVRAAGQLDQGVAGSGVAGVDQRAAGRDVLGDPHRVRLDRVVDDARSRR